MLCPCRYFVMSPVWTKLNKHMNSSLQVAFISYEIHRNVVHLRELNQIQIYIFYKRSLRRANPGAWFAFRRWPMPKPSCPFVKSSPTLRSADLHPTLSKHRASWIERSRRNLRSRRVNLRQRSETRWSTSVWRRLVDRRDSFYRESCCEVGFGRRLCGETREFRFGFAKGMLCRVKSLCMPPTRRKTQCTQMSCLEDKQLHVSISKGKRKKQRIKLLYSCRIKSIAQ